MNIDEAVEMEERHIEEMRDNGAISNNECSRRISDLHSEARAALEQEAQQAYDDVMNG